MSKYNYKHRDFFNSVTPEEIDRIQDLVDVADQDNPETVRELTDTYNAFWTADPQPLGCPNCRKKIIVYFQRVMELANE